MVKIFFFSLNGFSPMKDDHLRGLLTQSHGWQADGETWVFGVAIPRPGVDPNEVTDRLTSLGVHVLPGLQDTSTPKHHLNVLNGLSKFGITALDKTADIATKMHAVHGMPVLRHHLS